MVSMLSGSNNKQNSLISCCFVCAQFCSWITHTDIANNKHIWLKHVFDKNQKCWFWAQTPRPLSSSEGGTIVTREIQQTENHTLIEGIFSECVLQILSRQTHVLPFKSVENMCTLSCLWAVSQWSHTFYCLLGQSGVSVIQIMYWGCEREQTHLCTAF